MQRPLFRTRENQQCTPPILHPILSSSQCLIVFYLIILFYMDSLNKTRSLFDIKVHESKKALFKKTIGPVNRVHLTVLISVESMYIL